MFAITCFNLSLKLLIYFFREPSSDDNASFLLLSVLLSIKSITDSACVKSILPLRKALLVNSPFSAFLAPFSISSSKILSVVEIPP